MARKLHNSLTYKVSEMDIYCIWVEKKNACLTLLLISDKTSVFKTQAVFSDTADFTE